MEKRWINIDQLMKILPFKKNRIYYLIHTKQIPVHHVGRTPLFDPDEIHEWVKNNGKIMASVTNRKVKAT